MRTELKKDAQRKVSGITIAPDDTRIDLLEATEMGHVFTRKDFRAETRIPRDFIQKDLLAENGMGRVGFLIFSVR